MEIVCLQLKKIDNNHKQALAFKEASLKGWKYAMTNSDELIS